MMERRKKKGVIPSREKGETARVKDRHHHWCQTLAHCKQLQCGLKMLPDQGSHPRKEAIRLPKMSPQGRIG